MPADLERKTFTPAVALKADAPGGVTVEFATFNVVDLDGDITVPGAFGQQDVRIQSHGHDTFRWTIGKGSIRENGDKAVMDGLLNLDMDEGKEAHASLKFDLEHGTPLQEWSYTFSVVDSGFDDFEGRQVRFLKRLKVFSVDPVFLGAGIGTRTTAVKGLEGLTFIEHCEHIEKLLAQFAKRVQERAAVREKEGRVLSVANVEKLNGYAGSLKAIAADLEQLLADAEPKTAPELLQLKLKYERIRASLLGVA